MKRLPGFLLMFFCSAGLLVYGQRTEINQDTFFKAYVKMSEETDKRSQRIIYTSESSSAENAAVVQIPSMIVMEFIPSDKARYISKIRVKDEYVTTAESIIIGNVEYRKGADDWIKKDTDKTIEIYRNKIFAKNENARWFLTPDILLNGQKADLYEEIIEYRQKVPNPAPNQPAEVVSIFRQQYWITKDNLLLRAESFQSININGGQEKKSVYIYEYDPNIKIEAPVE